MAFAAEIQDPLTLNLGRQTNILLSYLPNDSQYATTLRTASSRAELLCILSNLLATPGLTNTIAVLFRPLLLDLCARWLFDEENLTENFYALCLLLDIHPEIYPIFASFVRRPALKHGPLAFVTQITDAAKVDALLLQRILLSYYRVLQANRRLPESLLWSLTPLAQLVWAPYADNGVRFLAVRCYALQSGMMEGERVKMEKEVIGDVAEVDCPIDYDANMDGSRNQVDGWLIPLMELDRISDARNAQSQPQDYFLSDSNNSNEPIHPAELSPLTANVHGILMLRSSVTTILNKSLIETSTAVQALRTLAIHHSLRVPTLITSAPSCGKSVLLSHLALVLHPESHCTIVTIHLADTSLDARTLLGSYVSSPVHPGTFEWREGVLVRAMREGRWIVLEDVDRASMEVLGVLKPLVESLGPAKAVGGRAVLEVPNRGRVEADDKFAIYATRSLTPSRDGSFASPTFYGAHKFYDMVIPSPTSEDLRMIVEAKFPKLVGTAAQGLIDLWEALKALGVTVSMRDIGLRELDKLCARADHILPASHKAMDIVASPEAPFLLQTTFPNPTLREDLYLAARDVFFGSGATTTSARMQLETIASVVAEHLGLSSERRDWLLYSRVPEFDVEKDVNGKIIAVRAGDSRLPSRVLNTQISPPIIRPFAMHRPAVRLLSRIATAVSLGEPVLLTGETGTGKTSVVTHLASLLNRPLVSFNLSNQTESSDLIGGFKPVDARVPGLELQERFLELFGGTFSRKKNAKFEESVRKAVQEGKWKRAVGLWKESAKLAKEKIQSRSSKDEGEGEAPRKRRKVEPDALNVPGATWDVFERDVQVFEVQHVQDSNKFAFAFVEGLLVKALRSGDWILLDEVNLASPETLECISAILHSPTASITLTEQGSLEPVPRHPDFRLFACMNPATDVGKKDLPPNIRSRFTEFDVPPPDADKETLLSIITQYIGGCAVGDKGTIMDVADFYTAVKKLADQRKIADGSNHRPHYSMRTLARALTFTADMASMYSLKRALWEGCLMTFTMALDEPSAAVVTGLAQKHLLAGVRNPRSLLAKEPTPPQPPEAFVKFGPFHLHRGLLEVDPAENYIMTPSVETKLIDLARIISARRFPVLIEGPTSSGKTSSIEYLAKRTGHRFVRINNHEHTDIQEYLGTYVSDAVTGKLVFRDGLLVQALRNGDWIVLDELNLAPTDVLEALNRLLDDNRELVIPETQEVVRPHPHFMLFATQNPPGLYAGRKILSRAFRNRFLEVHFQDVPQAELETILCQRCRIAPSYAQRIVSVFQELQKRRQSSRVFESKHGFATLRDLFRWAQRDALNYQELAENGYMLLAERTRREDDKLVVKEVIESIMKVRIDEKEMYSMHRAQVDFDSFLGCPLPRDTQLVWTSAMQRLFILLARALRSNEPVLLVGETGCGKTSVCQVYAEVVSRTLRTVNCHQNTETADLIGGLRPVRNRTTAESEALRQLSLALENMGVVHEPESSQSVVSTADHLIKSGSLDRQQFDTLKEKRSNLQKLSALFQWYDGPLVESMRDGDIFLLDEISLADDSVLERLNSALEPERTIVLAERGGDNLELSSITAADGFKLVATMNPGGDYGKKELSPALRNRFTEIWVPPLTNRRDLECIVDSLWANDQLKAQTANLLDFVEWLCVQANDRSLLSVRDILAWVHFSNAVHESYHGTMSSNEIFHHAVHMSFLDGLGSMSQFAALSKEAIETLRLDALAKVQELAPVYEHTAGQDPALNPRTNVHLGCFSIPRGPKECHPNLFNLHAPTTHDNGMRVVRACQLPKPILLEGSPGVGKTSLITALANLCGYELCRINLSDQTDLVDLFGSDLPVEGGEFGQFVWKDAEFLRALQEGHWVLLDEMNLAPQAILEGLNSVLDHRGTVYIPELGRSFTRHPSFRIFAAQNPLQQGGGRKGLPKSFLNRFTKVYMQELTPDDLLLVCKALFPSQSEDLLRGMITYTSRLNEEIVIKKSFATEGTPWEFNLRDVIRWGTLLQKSNPESHPSQFLSANFLQRFRKTTDREQARILFEKIFLDYSHHDHLRITLSPSFMQVGEFFSPRLGRQNIHPSGRILQTHLGALEALGTCASNGWLAIVIGQQGSGKTSLVRLLAHHCGRTLHEVSINSATDAADILGGFEEVDISHHIRSAVEGVINLVDEVSASIDGSKMLLDQAFSALTLAIHDDRSVLTRDLLQDAQKVLDGMRNLSGPLLSRKVTLMAIVQNLVSHTQHRSGLQWVDGPLVRALRDGHWLLLDGANLCNPSILDRLNSLCETNGFLVLNERGQVNGAVQLIKPHPEFRLFMSVDPQYGELSRAMRNRGLEIALVDDPSEEDSRRILDGLHLPSNLGATNIKVVLQRYEVYRRGLVRATSFIDGQVKPSGRLIGEDSAMSWLDDLAPVVHATSLASSTFRPLTNFITSSAAPLYLAYLTRCTQSCTSPRLDSNISLISSAIKTFPQTALVHGVYQLRERISRSHKIPLEFLLSQSLDFDYRSAMKLVLPEQERQSPLILRASRLTVALKLDYEDFESSIEGYNRIAVRSDRKADDTKSKVAMLVRALLIELRRAAQALLEGLNNDRPTMQTLLDVMLTLLTCGRHLQRAVSSAQLDYSEIRVVVGWIIETLQEHQDPFVDVAPSANALVEMVSLTSGLGLIELWSSLTTLKEPLIPEISQLESAMSRFNGQDARRMEILDLLSLLRLPGISTRSERHELAHLTENLVAYMQSAPLLPVGQTNGPLDDLCLAIELGIMSQGDKGTGSGLLKDFIDVSSRHVPLCRLVPLRQCLWAYEKGDRPIPYIAKLHEQWLEGIWSIPPLAEVKGPTVFLIPMELYGTVLDTVLIRKPLKSFQIVERALTRRLDIFATSLLQYDATRTTQLKDLLFQSVTMISSCFGASDLSESYFTRGNLTRPFSQLHIIESIQQPAIQDIFKRYLLPELEKLPQGPFDSESQMLGLLGRCWLALGRLTLELYVPNTPIDPAAMQRCSHNFWSEEMAHLSSQLRLHLEYERRTNGLHTNPSIEYLQFALDDAERHVSCSAVAPPPARNDLARLHSFWAEILQFIAQVISPARIRSIVMDSERRDTHVFMREEVVQESLTAFLHRLRTAYPDFSDLNGPIELALLYFKLGLRLLVCDARRADPASNDLCQVTSALVAFPSVRSAELLRVQTTPSSSAHSALIFLLSNLAGVVLEASLGSDTQSYIHTTEAIFEQIFGFWSIERARGEEADRAAQSLYRQNKLEHSATTDADMEEEEFLSMFPQFEGVFDTDAPEACVASKHSPLFDRQQTAQLGELHRCMFKPSADSEPSSNVTKQFLDSRRSLVATILESQATSLPETLDVHSRAFQIPFLHEYLGLLKGTHAHRQTYNFYLDANVRETRKGSELLVSFRARLEQLIQEWPDQMVLQYLRTRCDAVLDFSLSSPVAKVLSALEQLLLQTEDWEMYANRDNSLKTFQQNMIDLIVEWRRLELSSWQGLLESQAREFAHGAFEWWFRLYEALIKGVMAAVNEAGNDVTIVTEYLDGLVPLLDEFLTSSPIGQYHTRLELLSGFTAYIEQLIDSRLGISQPELQAALGRTARILRFTVRFYGQFATAVNARLASQQAVLEKDVRAFIKLASWKDINVHALKQSAQRTHRQLYKSIRKFRDVLRQPVTELMVPGAKVAEAPELEQTSLPIPDVDLGLVSMNLQLPDPLSTTDVSPHLAYLNRTYKTFERLIIDRMVPCLRSFSTTHISDLAHEIVTQAHALAAFPVPSGLSSAQREKLFKSLLTRKRRAWSELLKELKRIGLAASVKPEVLSKLHSSRWLREQMLASPDAHNYPKSVPDALARAEEYLHRLASLLPGVRATLADHHQDVNTRELQRGVMFLESGYYMALDSQKSICEASGELAQLEDAVTRLQMLATGDIVSGGLEALQHASSMKETYCKLVHALEEMLYYLREYHTHLPHAKICQEMLDEIQSTVEVSRQLLSSVTQVVAKMRLTREPILLKDEATEITWAQEHIANTLNALEKWGTDRDFVALHTNPVRDWLKDKTLPGYHETDKGDTEDSTGPLIDTLLLNMQALIVICPSAAIDEQEGQDGFVREDHKMLLQLTRALKLSTVVERVHTVLCEAARCPQAQKDVRLARVLPFLNQYVGLARENVRQQSEWTRALFKLDYVVCNVVRSLAREGFCKPPDAEEAGNGQEGGELQADGTGLGDGAGNENVSKDIEDESQVEGLQGEESNPDEKVERAEEGNAVEMSEDIGGQMQDISDGEGEEEGDEESEGDPEEQLGDLDTSDPAAVDEKLWGDESGPKDDGEDGGKSGEDHSKSEQQKPEMVAKEDSGGKDTNKEDSDKKEDGVPEDGEEIVDDAMNEDEAGPDEAMGGAPLDDHIQEAEMLDLPDDLDLDTGKNEKEELLDDDISMGDEEELEKDQNHPDQENADGESEAEAEDPKPDMAESMQEDNAPADGHPEEGKDDAIAQPDLHGGDGIDQGMSNGASASEAKGEGSGAEMAAQGQSEDVDMTPQADEGHQDMQDITRTEPSDVNQSESRAGDAGENAAGSERTQGGEASVQSKTNQPMSNPLRNLGDTLREIRQRLDDILESDGVRKDPMQQQSDPTAQMEYLQPDDTEEGLQALGPAQHEDVAKLDELKFVNEDPQSLDSIPSAEDQVHEDPYQHAPPRSSLHAEQTSQQLSNNTQRALMPSEVRSTLPDNLDNGAVPNPNPDASPALEDESEQVELMMQEWRASGQSPDLAGDIWRKYESLTHDLSYALCEQLRLILEPTMATRLKGDYRTGKRLNMKKIIPYIASEFTKDKIWLRRTRPSTREYQVLLALDDSRSMAESHSVHLALQTLALVARALSRLDVGELAIAKFGAGVDVLHAFDAGPFTDAAGAGVASALAFDQPATHVLGLVETSLRMLERARERRAMASATAGELWQLEIIISDGICQDHERLRSVLRKAYEQRVMVVFVILDSLHARSATGAGGTGENANSILSMSQVAYRTVDGRMDLHVERYLDTFPFEYYVVLRDVEALPEVLSGTLRQFFERMAEA
ncbi:uncharacterized protein FIBRA_00514 [Fibroporia radiculosa]|uniref:Midasin n=1 Tax=Fibroporia radiculosa TaxID=599839 RepID=J4GHZ0_9APHY|nr:uncharacterized protein FIBRA_00514 [Fibroporia radiculosa]CCL98515.1 predicted protein [Fibroporia radiculosa]